MTLEITIRGQILTQKQLDAIVPVLNKRMGIKMGKKQFEDACLEAMSAAGHPLIASDIDTNK